MADIDVVKAAQPIGLPRKPAMPNLAEPICRMNSSSMVMRQNKSDPSQPERGERCELR